MAPPSVILVLPLAGVPVILINPASPTMLVAVLKVIAPEYVAAVDELLVSAPPDEIPVPFSVRASAVVCRLSCVCDCPLYSHSDGWVLH